MRIMKYKLKTDFLIVIENKLTFQTSKKGKKHRKHHFVFGNEYY